MPQIEEAQPKYLQIAHYIRDQILRGDLRPGGTRFPRNGSSPRTGRCPGPRPRGRWRH